METYIDDKFPSLYFHTVDDAKKFAETVGYDEWKVVKLGFFPIGEEKVHYVGYGLIINNHLLR